MAGCPAARCTRARCMRARTVCEQAKHAAISHAQATCSVASALIILIDSCLFIPTNLKHTMAPARQVKTKLYLHAQCNACYRKCLYEDVVLQVKLIGYIL